jgi:hypothetical protein
MKNMKKMENRTMKFFLTSLLLIGMPILSMSSHASSADIKKELAAQKFSGVLNGDVKFTTLGELHCGANPLQVVFYEWYESSPPGKAVHSSYRVVLMHGTTYVGSYVVEDKPSIQGDEIQFPYTSDGNSIKCTSDGAPPKKVLLDGEVIPLAK